MATRKVPRESTFFQVTNTATSSVIVGTKLIVVGATENIPASHMAGKWQRLKDMADLVAAGRANVSLYAPDSGLTNPMPLTEQVILNYGMTGVVPPVTAALRPLPAGVPAGFVILNVTTGIPNFADGTNWVDATGAIV